MFNYFITLIVVYLGLPIGYLISYFAKEELKDGKKYFIFFKAILFSLIMFLFLMHINLLVYINVPLSLLLFFGSYFVFKNYNIIYNEIFSSCLMSIIFAEIFLLIPILLIFSFFIVSSALDYEKGLFKISKTRILFLVIGFFLSFL